MSTNLKEQIMEQNRHQFIYGYDGEERTKFLQSLETDYPISINMSNPMAIYMKDYSLSKTEITGDVDNVKLSRIHIEHFNFCLMRNIIEKVINLDIDNERLSEFLNKMSFYTIDQSQIQSLEEYNRELNLSIQYYLKYYEKLLKGSNENIDETKIQFSMIEFVIRDIKKLLKNNSYFGIIIDKKDDILLGTTKSINDLITSRINSDLSVKVACEPDKWSSYYDNNGMLAEPIHDYDEISFDDSFPKYMKKLVNDKN